MRIPYMYRSFKLLLSRAEPRRNGPDQTKMDQNEPSRTRKDRATSRTDQIEPQRTGVGPDCDIYAIGPGSARYSTRFASPSPSPRKGAQRLIRGLEPDGF